MKKVFYIGVVLLLTLAICAIANSSKANTYTIYQLTNDSNYYVEYPQLSDSGQAVWVGRGVDQLDEEITLYDGTNTVQLTNNDIDDGMPQINATGQVVWFGRQIPINDVFFYGGTNTITLGFPNDPDYGRYGTYFSDFDPQIGDSGHVVWLGSGAYGSYSTNGKSQVFLYDGINTIQLTDNDHYQFTPKVNSTGQVAWIRGGTDFGQSRYNEVILYDGINILQLTDDDLNDGIHMKINNNGQVVWVKDDGNDFEIYLYNGTSTVQLTDNNYRDTAPDINDSGHVVWEGWTDNGNHIFLYDGTETVQLTENESNIFFNIGRKPRINVGGQVVWSGRRQYSEDDDEIFLYDGTETVQLTDNNYEDYGPQINAEGQILWQATLPGEGWTREIFFATPYLDMDGDGDGVPDVDDGCPSDPLKIAPGACGCGVEDSDGDNDGTADCIDGCSEDPLKIEAGACGCGVIDTDSDDDGTADCNDLCPSDPFKIELGICGCGVSDEDSDGDGLIFCQDQCPDEDATGFDADADGCLDNLTGISQTITTLVEEGVIDTTMQGSLESKVDNAGKSASKENICAAVNQLEAFKAQVNAQAGGKVSEEGAILLNNYTDNIIAQLIADLPAGETCN